jgi:dienelactone hydrolase
VLLDWIQQQPALDASRIHVAGYSMGALMAMLLAGTDPRVKAVAVMVPPNLDDKVAAVSPRRAAPGLAGRTVWLLSADEDDYSTQAENADLFEAIAAREKRHLRFSSGHALPAEYVEQLLDWF